MAGISTRKAGQRARARNINAASVIASRQRAIQAWAETAHGKAKRDFEFTVHGVAALTPCSEMTSAKAQELMLLVGVARRNGKGSTSVGHKLALVARLLQAPGYSIGSVVMRRIPF